MIVRRTCDTGAGHGAIHEHGHGSPDRGWVLVEVGPWSLRFWSLKKPAGARLSPLPETCSAPGRFPTSDCARDFWGHGWVDGTRSLGAVLLPGPRGDLANHQTAGTAPSAAISWSITRAPTPRRFSGVLGHSRGTVGGTSVNYPRPCCSCVGGCFVSSFARRYSSRTRSHSGRRRSTSAANARQRVHGRVHRIARPMRGRISATHVPSPATRSRRWWSWARAVVASNASSPSPASGEGGITRSRGGGC